MVTRGILIFRNEYHLPYGLANKDKIVWIHWEGFHKVRLKVEENSYCIEVNSAMMPPTAAGEASRVRKFDSMVN